MRTIFAPLATIVMFSILCNDNVLAQASPDTPYCATVTSIDSLSYSRSARQESVSEFQVSHVLIFLDLDGATVRSGFDSGDNYTSSIISGTRNLPPPAMTPDQKAELVRLVADDFSPFNTRVTTDAAEFFQTPAINKQICIVTTTPEVAGFGFGIGGVSPFHGPGIRLHNAITFVFSSPYGNDPVEVASTVSHEVGHALGGLPHQHRYNDTCGIVREYHPGFGTGPLSFGPIMGDRSGVLGMNGISNWFGQMCTEPSFGSPVYDYELLNNQVTVRADDFPDTPDGGAVATRPIIGVLERAGDADFIRVNFKNPGPVTITSDNIDLKASLYTIGGHLLDEFNDPDSPNVTIPSANGMRYLKIEAASNENMSSQFMTGTYMVVY